MATIEERTAAREASLVAEQGDTRRLARVEDYVYDKSQENFWDLKDATMHSEKGVDASIPREFWRVVVEEEASEPGTKGRPKKRREKLIPPSRDISRVETDQFVEGSTWWPGQPQIIRDWFINADGFFPAPGRRIYNQYREIPVSCGRAEDAEPWVTHIKRLWPNVVEHEYFFDYCAHMIQRPEEKCNTAIVFSGVQGIGKDSALSPVKEAVGIWNVKGIDPDQLFSEFKPWMQTLMLVVNEVRPSKDEFHASAIYNILKPMIAAPPDTLPLRAMYQALRYVINVMRVIITTNDWLEMYIPPEDRRMFIMHSTLKKNWHEEAGEPDYFNKLFKWAHAGGSAAVGKWLAERDISQFDPKRESPKTVGWQSVAASWSAPEDGVAFVLDALGNPDAVFGAELVHGQFDHKEEVAGLLKSPRKLAHRMQKAGYMSVAPPFEKERWSFKGPGPAFRSRMAFVKQDLMGDQGAAIALLNVRGEKIAANPTRAAGLGPTLSVVAGAAGGF